MKRSRGTTLVLLVVLALAALAGPVRPAGATIDHPDRLHCPDDNCGDCVASNCPDPGSPMDVVYVVLGLAVLGGVFACIKR